MFKQFNSLVKRDGSLIQKALTTASGVGGALIPENLEQIITDTVVRMSPELAMIQAKKISGKVHEFNQLTERPARGGAIGENATTPATNSKTVRSSVELKVIRRKGKVTNFLSDTSAEYIDAAAYEMENQIQAHVLDMIYYLVWGNKTANPYEYDGLEQLISSNRVPFSNAAGGAVPTDLVFLDNMIDASNRKGGNRHDQVIGMSPELLSKVSSLLTNVRLSQNAVGSGLTQVNIPGGWRLNAYRDIPIFESTSLAPIEVLSSTVSLTGVGTGGGLSDGDYFIQVAPVTLEGEQAVAAAAEKPITLSGGGAAQRIEIDLDAVHTTNSVESALSYKIYGGTTTGSANLKLLKVVSAFTYAADGTPSGDNGVDASIYIDSMTRESSVPSHMKDDIPLEASGGKYAQSVVLWDLDPIQGLGKMPFTNTAGDSFEGLVTTKALAETDDFIQFLVKSYAALCPSFEKTSYWLRNIRTD